VNDALNRAFLDRPGEWRVAVTEPQNASYWHIVVQGPAGVTWNRRFDGPNEQNPDFIERTVRTALDERVPTFARISAVLDAKWLRSKACITCGAEQWSISELPYVLEETGGGKIMPVYPVTCTNCGFTMLFNAIRAGLLLEDTR
jgi:predicted nucleic-acid-binding Zn-ribbon protein